MAIGMVGSGLSSMGTMPGYNSPTSDWVTQQAMGLVGGQSVWDTLANEQRLAAMRNVRSNDRRAFAGQETIPFTMPTATQNPYAFGDPISLNNGATNFTWGGYGANGTTNWMRDDGTQFNLTRDQFNQYAPDYTNMYYGAGQSSPYQFGQPISLNNGQTQFTFGGYGANGTTNWTRNDGQTFNLTRDQFAQYAPQYADMYYGTGGMTNGTMPAYDPNSATAQNPFLNLGLSAFQNTQNPFSTGYLDSISKSLFQQGNQNLQDNLFPAMDQNAITAGGYGGDRSALAKGVAADRMAQSVFNAMAPQYQNSYEAWQNRALQGGNAAAGVGTGLEQLDLNRLLGMGGLGINAYTADTQRQLGLGNLNLGQYQADTQRQLGIGDLANRSNLTEAQIAKLASEVANPQYSNPLAAGFGGALGMAQLLKMMFGGD